MRWMLDCLGFSDDFLTEETLNALLGIAINQGIVYPTHYKNMYYVNCWLDWMQICVHVISDGEHNNAVNSDVHVPGPANTYWTCKVKGVLESGIKEDPLEKRIMITNKDGAGLAVLNLINADLLPSCDEGDEICVQVIGKAYIFKRYETDEECDKDTSLPFEPKWETETVKKKSQLTIATGSLIPIGLFSEHQININNPQPEQGKNTDLFNEGITVVRGKLVSAQILTAKLDGKTLSGFVSATIENDSYGVLNLITGLDCMPAEELKKLKPGDIIFAECVLSGDTMSDESQTALPLSQEHNLKVIKSSFNTGDFDRLWGVLSDNCFYESKGINVQKYGKDEIINYLKSKRKLMDNKPMYKYHAYMATTMAAPSGSEANIGKRCIALSQGDVNNFIAIAFITLNAENKVDSLVLCNEREYLFQIDKID